MLVKLWSFVYLGSEGLGRPTQAVRHAYSEGWDIQQSNWLSCTAAEWMAIGIARGSEGFAAYLRHWVTFLEHWQFRLHVITYSILLNALRLGYLFFLNCCFQQEVIRKCSDVMLHVLDTFPTLVKFIGPGAYIKLVQHCCDEDFLLISYFVARAIAINPAPRLSLLYADESYFLFHTT